MRIPALAPDAQSPEQAELYAMIASGPRAQGPQHFALTRADGSLTGPFNAFLLSPGLGTAVQELGAAVRYRTALSARSRELAILAVAAHWGSRFEQDAHESVGRSIGLSDDELTAVRAGLMPPVADLHERAAAEATLALIAGDIDDDQWQRWSAVLTPVELFELSTLVGYYALLALQLRAFRVDGD